MFYTCFSYIFRDTGANGTNLSHLRMIAYKWYLLRWYNLKNVFVYTIINDTESTG